MQTRAIFVIMILLLMFGFQISQNNEEILPVNDNLTLIHDNQISKPLESVRSSLILLNRSVTDFAYTMPTYDQLGSTIINFLNNASSLKDNRKSSILATYLTISTLLYLNYSLAMQYRESVYQYLLTKMDANGHFCEDIPYGEYQTAPGSLDDLNFAPYTSNLTHQIALWTLAKLDLLARFDLAQITTWIAEINQGKHADGGWGTLRYPNASIVETYYAIGALKGLYATKGMEILASTKQDVEKFLCAHQSKVSIPLYGIFYDNSSVLGTGWTKFLTSWHAVQLIRMIGSDPALYNADFTTFMSYPVFNPHSRTFADQVNNLSDRWKRNYGGTAIIGDCLYGLQLESVYNAELTEATNYLLNESSDSAMFRFSNRSYEYDLGNQYWILHYLNQSNQLGLLSAAKRAYLSEAYQRFFTLDGGASFQSNDIPSLATLHTLGDYGRQFSGVNTTRLMELIMQNDQQATLSGAPRAWFQDRIGLNGSFTEVCSKFKPYEAELTYTVASTYFALHLLQAYNLMDTFYARVGMRFNYFENWFPVQLSANGYFLNHTYLPNRGDLESTYYALAGQKILLDYNLRTFDYYYSAGQKEAIRAYVLSKVIETETEWLARCAGMPDCLATYYAQQILEMLGYGDIIVYSKFYAFLQNSIESMGNCSISERYALYLLIQANFDQVKLTEEAIDHHAITPLENFHDSCPKLLQSTVLIRGLSLMYSMRNLVRFLNLLRPSLHQINQVATYNFQLLSLVSIIPCDTYSLQGESENYPVTNNGLFFSASTTLEFNVQHPSYSRVFLYMANSEEEIRYFWDQAIDFPFNVSIQKTTSLNSIRITSIVPVLNSLVCNITVQNVTNADNYTIPVFIEHDASSVIYLFNSSGWAEGQYIINILITGGIPDRFVNASKNVRGISYYLMVNNSKNVDTNTNQSGLEVLSDISFNPIQLIFACISGTGGIMISIYFVKTRKQLIEIKKKGAL